MFADWHPTVWEPLHSLLFEARFGGAYIWGTHSTVPVGLDRLLEFAQLPEAVRMVFNRPARIPRFTPSGFGVTYSGLVNNRITGVSSRGPSQTTCVTIRGFEALLSLTTEIFPSRNAPDCSTIAAFLGNNPRLYAIGQHAS